MAIPDPRSTSAVGWELALALAVELEFLLAFLEIAGQNYEDQETGGEPGGMVFHLKFLRGCSSKRC